METQRSEKKEDSLLLARSKRRGQGMGGYYSWSYLRNNQNDNLFNDTLGEEDDNSYMDSNEIVSRTKFPESWLWLDVHLPACPRQTPNW